MKLTEIRSAFAAFIGTSCRSHEQTNFHAAEGLRLHQCPEIHVRTLENNPNIRGMGEPPVPPAFPALGNAIFAATGKRLRETPFKKFVDFV